MSDLASNLTGKTIKGWKVERKLSTRGGFSSAYAVTNEEGTPAFMKAVNVGYAAQSMQFTGSRVDFMSFLLEEFKHERDLLELCGDARLDRVVVALDSGEYSEASSPYFVPFLVFEFCKDGDVRRHPRLKQPDLAWRLKVFHGICIGVSQLHSRSIVHEDLKPANVLVFGDDYSKISDLGFSVRDDKTARSTAAGPRGDLDFAPLELLYGHYDPDWNIRHKGADLFMLGGLLAFLVADVHLVGLILGKLPPAHHPKVWRGGYPAALPAVRSAIFDTINDITQSLPVEIRADVREMLLWLCDAEPAKRGHPKTALSTFGDPHSLERIISIADRIAKQARRIR